MRLSKVLRTFQQVFPETYSKAFMGHFLVNVGAVQEYMRISPILSQDDKVLDFGCGTGEMANAVALGAIAGVGKPGQVVGVDINHNMVSYSASRYDVEGLSFTQVDSANKENQDFVERHMSEFSLVTSFHTMHWVKDHESTLRFLNKLMRPGGRFLFVLHSEMDPDDPLKKVFQTMKTSNQWSSHLQKTRSPDIGLRPRDEFNSWMTTFQDDGLGHISSEDFGKLIATNGFKIERLRSPLLRLTFPSVHLKGLQSVMDFPMIQEDIREAFRKEFLERLFEMMELNSEDGYCSSYARSILVIGEKISDVEY